MSRAVALRGLFVIHLPMVLIMLINCIGVQSVGAQSPVQVVTPVTVDPVLIIDQRAADKVRGGYVYSFSRFVTWSKTKRSGFKIAVVGNSRLASLMSSVAKRKRFTDRQTGLKYPIQTEFYKGTTAVSDCDLLYIGTNVGSNERNAILNQFATSNALVITDDTAFEHAFDARVKSTVRFVLQNGSVKFQLNLSDASRRGLTIDAKLLTAASLILPDENGSPASNTFITGGGN